MQTEHRTCEWPQTQPIVCLGKRDRHGLSDAIVNGTRALVAVLMLGCVVEIGKGKV